MKAVQLQPARAAQQILLAAAVQPASVLPEEALEIAGAASGDAMELSMQLLGPCALQHLLVLVLLVIKHACRLDPFMPHCTPSRC